MSEERIVRFTEEEILRQMAAGEPTGTDWEKVNSLTDEDIDKAIQEDPDAEELPEDFWERAVYVPAGNNGKIPIELNLDHEVVNYFQRHFKNVKEGIASALQEYVESKK